jgi:hypothetical protein
MTRKRARTICQVIINLTLLTTLIAPFTLAQPTKHKTLSELINNEEPGWELVTEWIKEGKNKIEVLPKSQTDAEKALLETQVTTRSPMGAVIYETGGILIDNGWIRIIGSGSERLNRSIMQWNKGKSYTTEGEQPSFLLIADDVIGGFYAINNGEFSAEDIGKVFYFAPDTLEWESLGVSYSDFLIFCFSGDLEKFYEGFRWAKWESDVISLTGNKGFSTFPFPWTKEGKDINNVSRKAISIEDLWSLYNGYKK